MPVVKVDDDDDDAPLRNSVMAILTFLKLALELAVNLVLVKVSRYQNVQIYKNYYKTDTHKTLSSFYCKLLMLFTGLSTKQTTTSIAVEEVWLKL